MIDKRPAAIARCATSTTSRRRSALPRCAGAVAVRGGGHNVAGTAVVDDGLVIDFADARGPHRRLRRDRARAGRRDVGHVDRVTAPLGLATPGGVVSETGVGVSALSGGVSHQRRRDGMTVDNLVSAEVVLADGRRVRASADENPDLFWALRGGGGNFGVVTSFELRLHPLGPEVFALNVAYPLDDAARVLAGWRDAVADAPDELSTAGFDLVAAGRRRAARAAPRGRHTSASPACGPAIRPRASAPRGPSPVGDPTAGHERAASSTSTFSARWTRSSPRARAATGRRCTSTASPTPPSPPWSTGRIAVRRPNRS